MPLQLKFRENDHDIFFHDIRVFLQGVEISQDISGTVSVTLCDRDGPNTAAFFLDNAMEKYQITDANLKGDFGVDDAGRYSEEAKRDIYAFKNRQTVQDSRSDRKTATTNELKSALEIFYNQIGRHLNTDFMPEKKATDQAVSNMSSQFYGNDKYVADLTEDMVAALLTENPDLDSLTAQKMVEDSVAKRAKGFIPSNDTVPLPTNSSENLNPTDKKTGQRRWSFGLHSSVIHRYDPIAIFAHNPLSEADEWMWAFKGYISEYPESLDNITGESILNVTCYCIREPMQKSRVALNGIQRLNIPEPLFTDAGIFTDLNNPGRTTHKFTNASMEAVIEYLVTGKVTIDQQHAGDLSKSDTVDGIGNFKKGIVARFPANGSPSTRTTTTGLAVPIAGDPSSENVQLLDNWHSLGLFGLKSGRQSSTTLKSDDIQGFLTLEQCTALGKECKSGGKNDPSSNLIHFLLPKQGTNVGNLVDFAIDTTTDQREWTNRYAVITEFLSHLDYQWYVAPHGDIMVEFPMYDFIPEDFGQYASVFNFDKHLINTNPNPQAGDTCAGLIVTGQLVTNNVQGGGVAGPEIAKPRVIVYSPMVAANNGVGDIETISLPFINDVKRLRAFAALEYQKRLWSSSSLDQQAIFRPFMLPNRPVYNVPKGLMGNLTAVSNSWTIFGNCETSVTMRYIRTRKEADTFTFNTGGTTMAISYRSIGSSNDFAVNNEGVSGIRIEPPDDNKTMSNGGNDNTAAGKVRTVRPGMLQGLAVETQTFVQELAECSGQEIVMTSGLRSTEANAAAHGSDHSKHLTGEAFDIRLRDPNNPSDHMSQAQIDAVVRCAAQRGWFVINEVDHLHLQKKRKASDSDYLTLPTAAERAAAKSNA